METKVLDYKITTDYPSFPVNQKLIVNTINPHSFCVAEKDTIFKKALQSSDLLIPDGIGIVLAVRLLKKLKIRRIAGADMHQHLIEEASTNRLKVFYLGSSQSVLDKIEEKIRLEYPNIVVSSFSPPYKDHFEKEDNDKIVSIINQFSPDILFVGMTAPKQEKWVFSHKNELDTKVVLAMGAVFDFYSGNIKRAPNLFIKLGMEWLYRLIKEPKRMWRRYLVNNFIFIGYVFKEFFRK